VCGSDPVRSRAVIRWEYRQVEFDSHAQHWVADTIWLADGPGRWVPDEASARQAMTQLELLNFLGLEGWELCGMDPRQIAVNPRGDHTEYPPIFYVKRRRDAD
jgi:hypothetical protein